MADFNALETLINAYIKKNGVQAITGNILNGVLRGMVSALGKGYTIIGVASPSTDPGTMTGPCAYYASQAGTYTNFGGLVVNDGDVAMLIYDEQTWHKEVMFSLAAEASVDANVGTPWVNASFENGMLTFTFGNMKGNPGDAAGFGTVNATVDSNIGTPGVSVQTSGPDTAKNMTFQFTNLKGETGVTSVVATVDNTIGTPSCAVSLVGQELHLDFSGLKGAQGDTGVSADYPITIVNNLTTSDPTSALSAQMGVQLESEISQLEHKVGDVTYQETPATITSWTNGKYIYGKDGSVWTSTDNQYATIPVSGAKKVRFLGRLFDSAPTSGFGFYDSNDVCISSATWMQGAPAKQVKEYVMDVPDGAVTFKVTSWNTPPGGQPVTVDDFYCYLITGETVLDAIEDVKDEIIGKVVYYGLDTAKDTLFALPHIYQGKQLKIPSAGTALSATTMANGDNYRNARVPVTGAVKVEYNSFTSSYGYGSMFVDENDLVISGHAKTSSESNPIILDVPATAKYLIFGYTIANPNSFNHITVKFPVPQVGTDKIADDAVTTPKIADGAVTKEKLEAGYGDIFGQTKNLFDPTDPDFETGYFLNVDGTKSSQSSSAISPYIPFTQEMGTLVASVNGVQMNYGGYAIVLYNASKQVVTGWQEGTKGYAEWQTNVAYARFTLTNYANGNIQIEQGTTPTSYIPYKKGLDGSKLLPKTVGTDAIADGAITEDKLSGAVLAGGPIAYSSLGGESRVATIASLANDRLSIEEYPRHLKRSGNISATAYITTFDNIIVGVINGTDNYNALYAKVDSTKVYLCRRFPNEIVIAQETHGLTISTFVKVSISYRNNVAKVVVSTLADTKTFDFNNAYIDSYGFPVVIAGENSQFTNVALRAGSADMRKPVWFFGDSYVSFYSDRWPYYLLPDRANIDKYALFGLAGGTSSNLLFDVEKALQTNTPKFLVWCLGMNDIDSGAVNAGWKSAWDSVIAYCEAKGIEFIGATIPCTPTRDHTYKNAIVRASGYRYIDFAKAVNAETAGASWYAGCLDDDNVHPTAAGAKVLCSQVLEDFPEIIDRDSIFD